MDEEDDMDFASAKEEELVTPYSICNLTNVVLRVQRLNNVGETGATQQHKKNPKEAFKEEKKTLEVKNRAKGNNLKREYIISPGEQIDYAVDYEL
mmetsp:Transcript_23179/g.22667  ORF Transcript_23179/g.22667 Transcript_23179/m.22667 type:complete len:95 (-) Transcript_23179:2271-2555(-)